MRSRAHEGGIVTRLLSLKSVVLAVAASALMLGGATGALAWGMQEVVGACEETVQPVAQTVERAVEEPVKQTVQQVQQAAPIVQQAVQTPVNAAANVAQNVGNNISNAGRQIEQAMPSGASVPTQYGTVSYNWGKGQWGYTDPSGQANVTVSGRRGFEGTVSTPAGTLGYNKDKGVIRTNDYQVSYGPWTYRPGDGTVLYQDSDYRVSYNGRQGATVTSSYGKVTYNGNNGQVGYTDPTGMANVTASGRNGLQGSLSTQYGNVKYTKGNGLRANTQYGQFTYNGRNGLQGTAYTPYGNVGYNKNRGLSANTPYGPITYNGANGLQGSLSTQYGNIKYTKGNGLRANTQYGRLTYNGKNGQLGYTYPGGRASLTAIGRSGLQGAMKTRYGSVNYSGGRGMTVRANARTAFGTYANSKVFRYAPAGPARFGNGSYGGKILPTFHGRPSRFSHTVISCPRG